MRQRVQQMELFPAAKRRRRKGRKRGPKTREDRLGFVAHVARPFHDRRHPVHVSIRRVRLAPSFRSERVHAAIVAELTGAKRRGVRVVQYSIQDNHIHLMIEGEDGADLSKQMRTLFSRMAFAVNAVSQRHGSLFRDRHHRRELKTPTETRNALIYILFNDRKHEHDDGVVIIPSHVHEWLDGCSSAPWFLDWNPKARPPPEQIAAHRARHPGEPPVTAPATWMARTGWQRGGGLIRFHEMPRARR